MHNILSQNSLYILQISILSYYYHIISGSEVIYINFDVDVDEIIYPF